MALAQKYSRKELREAEDFRTMALPLWREALLGLDWLSLRASAAYRGIGIPHGDGSAVVLVPGFLASDRYLGDLHSWLGRIHYQPHMSGIGRVSECPDILTERLGGTIRNAADATGRKVHLIGHSMGGLLARSAAARWPRKVASVITMASPFRGVRAHPLVVQVGQFVRGRIAKDAEATEGRECFTGRCSCAFVESLRTPLPAAIHQTAIYTTRDGVVDWTLCVTGDPACDVEVPGTHVGLAFNPKAYETIAERLAAASTAPSRK